MSNLAPEAALDNNDSSSILKLIHTIPDLVSDAYESQLGAIHTLAESLENFQEHNTYKMVKEELGHAKPSVLSYIAKQFVKNLNEARKVSLLEEEQALNFHTDHLSIVTDGEIEYQLMLEKGFTDSNHHFAGMLVESGWKFCAAVKKSSANAQLECVRPGFLALVLQDAIDHFIEDKQVARIAYRFIGAKFFSSLKDFFHDIAPELNQLVEQHREQEKAESKIEESKEQSAKADYSQGNGLPLAEVEDGVTAEDIEEINKTLGTNIDVTGLIKNWDVPAQLGESKEGSFEGFTQLDLSQISPDTQIRTASIEDVTQLLKTLTRDNLIDTDQILDTNDVRTALKESLSQLSDEGILTVIDRVSENVLNLVSHLFDTLNESGNFISDVQNQIARLQPSVMQVALTDTKLFQSNEHPVREYLNQVSNLGLRISEPSEEGFMELRDSIADLLKEFSGDIEIFEAKAHELADYIDDSVYAIKNVDGEFEAREFAKALNHTSISDFLDSQNHLLEKELTFHKLIKYVWGAILARVIRRHGTESEEWNHATETYASVLWSTQVDATDDGKRDILRNLPGIVQSIRGLFLEYNLKKELRDAILEHMIQLHLAIIRGTDGKSIKDPGGSSLDIFKCFQGKIMEETDDNHHVEFEAVEVKGSNFAEEELSNVYERFDQISPFEDIPTLTDSTEVDWGDISSEDETMIQEIRSTKKDEHAPEDLEAVFARLNQLPLDSIFMLEVEGQETRCKLTKKSVTVGTFTFKSLSN
ncbi:MAG: DUF1631 domain-containing protein [Pseudomonadales bacterium]|nr:DUF1631 domain-containing protein [Pseudomonadales bacterium]